MQIERSNSHYKWYALSKVAPNATVTFRHCFHRSVMPDDVFLALDVAGSYEDRPNCTFGKIGVVNLRTAKLSFVNGNRDIRFVDAGVVVND